ncbi:hypothetical protein D2Q93_15640 [Alicyclobacillaceae bacterium I2511]|nr:hypothetical protein D2Q93_15640 [Alicyclobacillaceae bacterium I2511]
MEWSPIFRTLKSIVYYSPGLSPHVATFAIQLDQAQVNLSVIQIFMGHSDFKTTARYVGVAEKRDVGHP